MSSFTLEAISENMCEGRTGLVNVYLFQKIKRNAKTHSSVVFLQMFKGGNIIFFSIVPTYLPFSLCCWKYLILLLEISNLAVGNITFCCWKCLILLFEVSHFVVGNITFCCWKYLICCWKYHILLLEISHIAVGNITLAVGNISFSCWKYLILLLEIHVSFYY